MSVLKSKGNYGLVLRQIPNHMFSLRDIGLPDKIKELLYHQLKHRVLWDANLRCAVGEGIGRIYEFGGGVGKGGPEEKRPNLEGMIKKAVRSLDPRPEYVPAINVATLEAAA